MTINPQLKEDTDEAIMAIWVAVSEITKKRPNRSTVTAEQAKGLRTLSINLLSWLDEADRVRDAQSYSKAKHDAKAKKKSGFMTRAEDFMSRIQGR